MYVLCQSFIIISFRGRVPRVRLDWWLHVIHLACKMVRDGEVERRRMEPDVAPTKPRPAVPCRIDPPDEVEVIHVLDRTEVRSLQGKYLSTAHTKHNKESLAHFAELTETRPSFGPSFSRTTECGHL
jgi:hypothetical protein